MFSTSAKLKPKAKKPRTGYELRDGNLVVAVCDCCDATQFCIDVREERAGEYYNSDHDASGLSVSASMRDIETYLHAALACAKERFAATNSVGRIADPAACAGCDALAAD